MTVTEVSRLVVGTVRRLHEIGYSAEALLLVLWIERRGAWVAIDPQTQTVSLDLWVELVCRHIEETIARTPTRVPAVINALGVALGWREATPTWARDL